MTDSFGEFNPPIDKLEYARHLMAEIEHLQTYLMLAELTDNLNDGRITMILRGKIMELRENILDEMDDLNDGAGSDWEKMLLKSGKDVIAKTDHFDDE